MRGEGGKDGSLVTFEGTDKINILRIMGARFLTGGEITK